MKDDDARDAERGGEASLAKRRARGRGVLRRRRDAEPSVGDRKPDDRTDKRAFLGAVTDRLIDIAPRIPVRDLATLRRQFPGLGPEEIADRLVAAALKGSATVGAGVGAAAMLPVPPAMPAELAAEIVGVATIELKLVAELHEVYGVRPPGSASSRGLALLRSWSTERGIDPAVPAGITAAFGLRSKELHRQLRHTVWKRTVRNLPNLTPFLVGAAAGAWMNRRDTRKLADHIRTDLRGRQVPWEALEASPQPALPDSSSAARRFGRRDER